MTTPSRLFVTSYLICSHLASIFEGYPGRRNMHGILVGKPEGYGSLEKPGHKCADDIKVDIK
jgi:hypothetical protein